MYVGILVYIDTFMYVYLHNANSALSGLQIYQVEIYIGVYVYVYTHVYMYTYIYK